MSIATGDSVEVDMFISHEIILSRGVVSGSCTIVITLVPTEGSLELKINS